MCNVLPTCKKGNSAYSFTRIINESFDLFQFIKIKYNTINSITT